MSKIIIVRQFRGQRLFLTDYAPASYSYMWSADRAKALKFTDAGVVASVLRGANEFQSAAYAIDSAGNVIVPAASAEVVKPLGIDLPPWNNTTAPPDPEVIATSAAFQLENHGSLFLVRPLNDAAAAWLAETSPEDAQFIGDALVVEPRYVPGVVSAIQADGMTVQS